MKNELCKNNFSVPTFEETFRMNDYFSSFLCPYCGKWHRLGEYSSLSNIMKEDVNVSHNFALVACFNPDWYTKKMCYSILFTKDNFEFEIIPYNKLPCYEDSLHKSCTFVTNAKNFSGRIPYSSFYLHPKWSPDLPEIKYLCSIEAKSLKDVCGAENFALCNHCYLYDCLKENRPIQLGFGFKYNFETAIYNSLEYIFYNHIYKIPEVFYDLETKGYLSLFSRDDNGRFIIDKKNFYEWLLPSAYGKNIWASDFMNDLLAFLLKDDKDKDLKGLLDSRL